MISWLSFFFSFFLWNGMFGKKSSLKPQWTLPLTSELAIRSLFIVQACHTVGVRPPLIVIVKLWTRHLTPPAPTCKRGQRSNRAARGTAAHSSVSGGDGDADNATTCRMPGCDNRGTYRSYSHKTRCDLEHEFAFSVRSEDLHRITFDIKKKKLYFLLQSAFSIPDFFFRL